MRSTTREVRLSRNGRNQALRIPRGFELEGDRALVRRQGDRLIVEPIHKGRLLSLLDRLSPLEGEAFPDVEDRALPLDAPRLGR